MADAAPAAPLLLASRSPQRRSILEQLGIPFEVVAPSYEEELARGMDAVELVRLHAREKARSVADGAGDRPVLGVDTEVVCDGRVYGKPRDGTEAEAMLEALSGRTHEVVSGLCLVTPGWEEVHEIAEELEHISSRKLVDQLDAFLGYPDTDPHGDPIPDSQGRFHSRRQVSLSELPLNKEVQVSGIASQTLE